MKPSTVIVLLVSLVALGAGIREARQPEAKPASRAAAPGAVPTNVNASVIDESELAKQERGRQLALEIGRTLVVADPQQRETAFNVLLPELLEMEPARVIALVARQEPGEARDALRDEVARQWITLDRDAAIEWMGSLEEADRKAGATIAMRRLAASDPAQAIYVADLFGVGGDDGSLAHIVQIWATENPAEAARWLESQPPNDPRTAQLRARIE